MFKPENMTIAIIGAGNVGGALAIQWQKAGHRIIIGARDPASPKTQKIKAELPEATQVLVNVMILGVQIKLYYKSNLPCPGSIWRSCKDMDGIWA